MFWASVSLRFHESTVSARAEPSDSATRRPVEMDEPATTLVDLPDAALLILCYYGQFPCVGTPGGCFGAQLVC